MFKAPINNVIVQIETKYIRNITDIIRLAHVHNAQINPADCAQIIGTIVSIPKRVTTDVMGYEGFTSADLRVGDIAIFRYDVVFDFVQLEESEDATFRNIVWFKGKEYWVADIQKVFGVIRGEEIVMVNGYCMVEDISPESKLIMAQRQRREVPAAHATLTGIGNPLTYMKKIKAEKGDTVYFNRKMLQTYQINKKTFGIISQHQILGYSIGNFATVEKLN
jgi:co-chaperonin GroES (HSP10)